MKVVCPYCNQEAPLVTGDKVYPHRPELHWLRLYRCAPCDAHVGVHRGTEIPLGTLANAATRKARNKAHAAFDPLWQLGRAGDRERRLELYAWLAKELGIQVEKTHIALFDVETCRRVVELCSKRAQEVKR